MVVHSFNPNTLAAEAGKSFEASLVYTASSTTARATQKSQWRWVGGKQTLEQNKQTNKTPKNVLPAIGT